jgi:2-oxoglutarate ferredoxin oxidoreductase subunit alpha
MDINIRITGEAGQGVQTIGDLLTHSLHETGLHVFATQSYMSRIRGGVKSFDIRASDSELHSAREDAHILVALTDESLHAFQGSMASGGIILFDGKSEGDAIAVDMAKEAKAAGGTAQMANSVAAGMVMRILGYDVEVLYALLKKQFSKKSDEVVAANVAAARRGFEIAAGYKRKISGPTPGPISGEVYSGSEVIGLSAALAGVKVMASYPMTPSTGVFTYLAGVADKYRIVVEQAEDEICAVNLICGATYAGVPAMTTTSGGGFALMAEGLSLAGMLELPIVIFLSQRPGPATGLPTRTAQEDLMFAVHAGHGEFPRAVFAPGSLEQAFKLTRYALETAHRFQTPVILMADQFLTDLQKNIALPNPSPDPINRFIIKDPLPDYKRYAVTEDGISPRAIPGSGPFVIVDSDEQTTEGHITEDLDMRVKLQDKRICKGQGMHTEAIAPEVYPEPADNAFVCWGSSHGPCREAVDILRADGRNVCMIHFSQVWPINTGVVKHLLMDRKVIAVEGNSTAQFARLLRQAGALENFEAVLRYDGRPFTGRYIAGKIRG